MPLPSAAATLPKIIHQLWKNEHVPEHLAGFVQSWRSHHPEWEYRLWTDADLNAFIAAEHPDFLPLFHGYRHPINRADAARYLILKRFGGLYVDLDFECFRPIEPLLNGASCAIGLEPAEHVALEKAVVRALPRILCPSLIASIPGHPFWNHVLAHLRRSHACDDVLDATGPFMLTRALQDFDAPSTVMLLPASAIYPATKQDCWEGALFDIPAWDDRTQDAYALHHWDGGWFRPGNRDAKPRRLQVELTNPNRRKASGAGNGEEPKVSALMVTRNRFAKARLAVASFRQQTYRNRELIVVDDGSDERLAEEIASLGDSTVRIIRYPDLGQKLGALRNIAVSHATGSYICQWDDDDLYDPLRLELQMMALRRTGAGACVLKRWTIWWSEANRFAVSHPRLWEGSLLCEKAFLPPYPELRRGEDTPVVDALSRSVCIAHLDLPRLYIYVVHGRNTFEASHFHHMWAMATRRFSGSRADDLRRELERRVPLSAYADTIRAPVVNGTDILPTPAAHVRDAAPSGLSASSETFAPSVLVLVPVKNARPHLPSMLSCLMALDHPSERLSLAFMGGGSDDGSDALLQDWLPRLRTRFRRVELLQEEYSPPLPHPRWAPTIQRRRRSAIAKARNRLLSAALRDETHVLWVDADVIRFPSDVLQRLLAAGEAIVTPNCVIAPGGRSFDLNTFQHKPGAAAEEARFLIDGLIQPPSGQGRLYLHDLRQHEKVAVDSVGGTMLLVKADLHREGLVFPIVPHRGYIETEGFAMIARELGHTCWALPNLEILHARA